MIINNICKEIASKDKVHSVAGDMAACAAITLTAGFWTYEGYISQKVMNILNIAAAVLMVIAWIYLSFSNGTRDKIAFPVFTALFWVVPIVIYQQMPSTTDPLNFNAVLYGAAKFCEVISCRSFMNIALLNRLSPMTASVCIASVSIIFYIVGYWFTPKEQC